MDSTHSMFMVSRTRASQPTALPYLLNHGWQKGTTPQQEQDVFNRLCILYDLCPHWSGYHHFNRNEKNKFDDALRHVSYLAKKRGKGYKSPQTKNYGHRRLNIKK